jgi:transcriptional regulator with XRE-family HTH domain
MRHDLDERKRIGRRIAQLRHEKGLSQRDLAEIAGIKHPHIARIETGAYSVGFDTLQCLAKALGKNVDIT